MRLNVIQGALPITARLLANELGLVLHFGAPNFKAGWEEDGTKHLYIPNLPMDDTLAGPLALGGVVHEDGHFGATNPDEIDDSDKVLVELTNVLEDIRIEGFQMRKYPGARKILAQMVDAMVKNGQFAPISAADGPGGLLWYVLYRLRADVLGQAALCQSAEQAAEVAKEVLPAGAYARLTAMMFEVVTCQSTADCVALAKDIMKMLKDESENPSDVQDREQSQQAPDSGDLQQNLPSQDHGASQGGSSPSDQGKIEQGEGSPDVDPAGTGSGNAEPGGNTGDGTETTATPLPALNGEAEKADALRQFIAGAGKGPDNMDLGQMVAESLNELNCTPEAVRLPDVTKLQLQLGHGENVLERLRSETIAVRRRIQALLEAQTRSKVWSSRTGNRPVARNLWKLQMGNAKVFEQRIEGLKHDTAIEILLDRSPSMNDRISVAADAALATALAMEGVNGVTTAVAAFPYLGNGANDDVLLVSDFGESVRKSASRFPAIGTDGGTPMSEAMLWSGYHLHQSGKTRKIMVVVCDGKPNNVKSALTVIERLKKSGIEVLAIGIKADVSGVFDRCCRIDDIRELAPQLFGMLQRTLAKAA